jgi:SAM-dependent methyltransferase
MDIQPGVPEIPIPPIQLRRTVGIEDTSFFDNPHRDLVFGKDVNPDNYQSVFDFGCGCGRTARQMMLHRAHVPQKFVGVDLYKPSIDWCTQNLTSLSGQFRFYHHDFYNAGLNPNGSKAAVAFPDFGQFSLVNAHSVFTHIIEDHVRFYFEQVAKLVADQGCVRISWFLFDKALFPMMQTFQNALYINTNDATNAVIYDKEFVRSLYKSCGLDMYSIRAPGIRGHQWLIYASRGVPVAECAFPDDASPIGLARPPVSINSGPS